MKILLFGKTGQVGWELERCLPALGELHAVDRTSGGNFLDPAQLIKTIHDFKPDVIVNAAAYTAVDQAEKDMEAAFAVNAKAPEIIAKEAKRLGALFIHYSTDYVFDGMSTKPYQENDATNPLNVYGQSKLFGEQAIQAAGGNHLILRTSWVYSMRGKNFLLTMLRLANEKKELRIVDDQSGAPTLASCIAQATAQLTQRQNYANSGIYHLTCAGETSWKDFAVQIFQNYAELNPNFIAPKVIGIPSQDYPTPAKRPLYSVLNNGKIKQQFNIEMPSWKTALKACFN